MGNESVSFSFHSVPGTKASLLHASQQKHLRDATWTFFFYFNVQEWRFFNNDVGLLTYTERHVTHSSIYISKDHIDNTLQVTLAEGVKCVGVVVMIKFEEVKLFIYLGIFSVRRFCAWFYRNVTVFHYESYNILKMTTWFSVHIQ